jgi:hypothetical protein
MEVWQMADDAEHGRERAERGRVRAEGVREFAERGDEQSRVLNEKAREAAEGKRRGSWVHRYNGAILGTLIGAVIALSLLCGYLGLVLRQQDGEISSSAAEADRKIQAAAAERRHQIIQAGAISVGIGCRDVNHLRSEIKDTRPRLRALLASGDITRGLYDEAIAQGDRRLARLQPKPCRKRAERFRHIALNGR